MSVSIMTPTGEIEVPVRGGGYKFRDDNPAASFGRSSIRAETGIIRSEIIQGRE